MPLKVMSDALPFAVWAVVAQRFVADLARGAVGSAFGFPTESADPEPAIREDRASDEPSEPPRD
jgi:hypothetical protein